MDQSSQLQSYIQNRLTSGVPEDLIKNELLRSGWSVETIDAALHSLPQLRAVDSHRTRTGVLWILSPFILLIAVAAVQIIVRLLLDGSIASSPLGPVVNIISILGGIAGVILLPVGPIIGIIKLTRR